MFRPRHAYKSPITNRYRGRAKGCPVFNNLNDINSNMVEQHDECLECLAKIKNRTDLYQTLADNNKPSNNVIKSLQRLSSSASNNRLKTCLQFLIIKVNEKSIKPPQPQTTTTNGTNYDDGLNIGLNDAKSLRNQAKLVTSPTPASTTKNQGRRQKSNHHQRPQQLLKRPKLDQLASPPQDQVSSTQDQINLTKEDHDCQTSPMMLDITQIDEVDQSPVEHIEDSPQSEHEVHKEPSPIPIQSSPPFNHASTTSTASTSSSSPFQSDTTDAAAFTCNSSSSKNEDGGLIGQTTTTTTTNLSSNSRARRSRLRTSSDQDPSSTASWSSYASPPSPMSITSECSMSSASSESSATSTSSSLSLSPSPISSPEIINELRGPRLKISEGKIRKIQKRPILFDDHFTELSFASTPTTSSGCSPGQHSITTQNSEHSRLGLPSSNLVSHMFQAPPKFVNNLKPCNLPAQPQEPPTPCTPPAPTKEMLNCAICGIRDRPPNIGKIHGQNSCLLCTRFFASFLKRPKQLYCAQDGDCLMTFDSRCQACWIKICLQKFDIEDDHRKIRQKYSPKLLSSPNVSLITIDTSLTR